MCDNCVVDSSTKRRFLIPYSYDYRTQVRVVRQYTFIAENDVVVVVQTNFTSTHTSRKAVLTNFVYPHSSGTTFLRRCGRLQLVALKNGCVSIKPIQSRTTVLHGVDDGRALARVCNNDHRLSERWVYTSVSRTMVRMETYLVAHDGRDGVETDVQSAGELIDVLPSNFLLVRGSHVDIRALPYVEYAEEVQVDQFK